MSLAPAAHIAIRKEPYYRRDAFEQGLKKLGYRILDGLPPSGAHPQSRGELLVLWNKKRGLEEQVANTWEKRGGTVIVAENGYLQHTDKTTYAVSVHGHNGSGWFPVGTDDRFTPLGFEVKPWRESGDVVVRAQRGIGSTLMASPPMWAEKMQARLQAQTRGKVRLARHPGDKNKLQADFDALRGAKQLFIWSSAMGVRALVEGVNVVHAAPHWICERWAQDSEDNYADRRLDVLQRMAHGQWKFQEIATGEPFARMRDAGWGPTWA